MFGTPSSIQALVVGVTTIEVFGAVEWTYTTWLKQTSGVVTIGTDAELSVTATGKGMLLPVDNPVGMLLAPGTRIYAVASTAAEAVAVHIQRFDFVSKIIELLSNTAGKAAPKAAVATMPYPGQPEFNAWIKKQKKG